MIVFIALRGFCFTAFFSLLHGIAVVYVDVCLAIVNRCIGKVQVYICKPI